MATDWLSVCSLGVAAVGLYYLIKYAGYTKEIAESTSKPAVIAIHTGTITTPPRLRNIGIGPALDVEWAILGTKKSGKDSCIEAGNDSDVLSVQLSALERDAVLSGANRVTFKCSYRSISGRKYSSVSDYDFTVNRFSTTFGD